MHYFQFFKNLFTLAIFAVFIGAGAVVVHASDEGILLVAFGTSVPEAKSALDTIDKEYHKAFPDTPIVWAYTSQIIRKKLAKQGIKIGSIGQGLNQLAEKGIKIVRVQSLHVMAGEEFASLARSILVSLQKHPGRFKSVFLGRPLLESDQDARETAQAILNDLNAKRKKGEAVALMSHGQEKGRADLVFEGVRNIFREYDPLAFMATVEGSHGFDDMAKEMKNSGIKKIWLTPMMIVAGDHARTDLAGDGTDSWASRLKSLGYEVQPNMRGLGDIPEISNIFIRHTKESTDDLVKEPVKP